MFTQIDARLENRERQNALVGKLFEEAEEFLQATTQDTKMEELADLFEIIRALATDQGTTLDDVMRRADEKRLKRGGFDKGVVLVETAIHAPSAADGQHTLGKRWQDLVRARPKSGGFIVPLLALMKAIRPSGITISLTPGTTDIKLKVGSGALDIDELSKTPAPSRQLALPVGEKKTSNDSGHTVRVRGRRPSRKG